MGRQYELEPLTNKIMEALHHTSDLVISRLKIDKWNKKEVNILFLKDIVDTENLHDCVIQPLLNLNNHLKDNKDLLDSLRELVLETSEVEKAATIGEMVEGIIQGNALLLCNGHQEGLIISASKWAERSLEEAISERSSRGPIVGFTENMGTNINLIRGALRTSDLCIETQGYGSIAKKQVAVLHVEGIADHGILKEVKNRLKHVNVKYLASSKIIQQTLEGKQKSFFLLVRESDRVDSVVSSLMEGRIVVLVDGFPYAIIAPALFVEFMQGADEYHQSYGRLSNRLLRFSGYVIGLFLPAVYVAVEKFHKSDLPKKVSETLLSKEELLPTFWEMIILLTLLRVLIDVSFHIPKSTIIVVSLLGTILIGETAVTAKLIHPVSLIVTGVTAVSNFLTLNRGLGAAQRVVQLTFLIVGYFFGFKGLIIGTTTLIIYMVSLKSIGVPFLSPIIPFKLQELSDVFYRGDLQKLNNSPHHYTQDKG
ncbi:spore germination protein [Sutcliffiella halmapala]|uniref:spore germination protein n=1 Tax=Sutcliffiella halmapala TaxID=79882 RepID=UPI000994B145|nr:spore germination protein [Sutcliffiella halmapala]